MLTNLKKNQNNFLEYLSDSITYIHKNIFNTAAYKQYKVDEPYLQKYIDTSRLQKENANINHIYYDSIYLHVKNALKKHNIHVTFQTVYSLNRKNETLEINNKNFIIYDQYLGKTINLFNKAFLQLNDPHVINHYCFRYLVESFRVKGMGVEADMFIELGKKTNSFEKLNSAYRAESLISSYTYIQETFIIFHEIAHLIVKKNPRYLNFRFNKISKYIDDQPLSILNKLSKQKNENIENFEFNLDDKRRKNLVEEITCDYIATKYTFEALLELNLLEPAQFCEAIYLGLRSMRSLNLLDGYITSYSNRRDTKKTNNLSQLFKESSIRFWLIKDSISLMYKGKYRKKFSEDPLLSLLEKDMKECSKFYEDPFHKINSILDELSETITPEVIEKVSYAEQQETLEYVDKVLQRVSN